VTREEAYEHIAAVMNYRWPHIGYTPERVAERLEMLTKRRDFVSETEMYYAEFALDVLKQSGVLE
jgi:hypothetical protein